MPRWWGQVNKRLFNKAELARGKRPVIIHTGRNSGMEYETPLDAHEVDDGYVFILMYGSESDWVKNVRAADAARLRLGDETVSLHSPRIVGPSHLPSGVKLPPSFLKVDEVLRMDRR